MARTLAGSAAGSVTGLVAADSIRGAIASGKKSRNASTQDRYNFGDLSRGMVRSMKVAAKTGGKVRQGSNETYKVGDFTVGASRSVCNYTTQNKSRLAAASGSGMGMTIGAAVAGPLGFVAGGYIGSKLGGSEFEEDDAKLATSDNTMLNSDASETSHHRQGQAMNEESWAATALIGSDADLLGLNAPVAGQRQSDNYQPSVTQDAGKLEHSRPSLMETNEKSSVVGSDTDLLGLGYHYDSPTANHTLQLENRTPQPTEPPKLQLETSAFQSPIAACAPTIQPTTTYCQSTDQTSAAPPIARIHPLQHSQQAAEDQGYRFGDLTRSAVARGKRRDGRGESEGYKFGDFTRGLFG